MNRHQVLTGAANAGGHSYSVGSVEGVPFTAYASGCNIVILASDFQRVQIIPGIAHGNVQVGCLDCSTDVGKIAAAYGKEVCIYEPTPLLGQGSQHKLDYQWVQTAAIATEYHVQVLSWNLAGSRLLTGGTCIQLWQLCLPIAEEDAIEEEPTTIQVTLEDGTIIDKNEQYKWDCIWKCKTAQPVAYLKFSPDGTLFASAGIADRLVKIWYSSKVVCYSSQSAASHIKYTFIYIAHPRAITGLSWRKTSKFMPRDSVANMLVTSCRDNICRVWVQTLVPEDGLVNFQQIEALANETPRAQTQRHRRKIMQRLKHMKSMNQYKRRQATQFTEDPNEAIPTLPSTYSVHDFHSFGLQGSGITPGLHFHLAASINADTDIPLVPRLNGGSSTKDPPNFVLHWLNNKEMEFTHAAEHLIQDVSAKVLNVEVKDNVSDQIDDDGPENLNVENGKVTNGPKCKKITVQSESQDNNDEEFGSKRSSSNASSSTSIATDASNSQSQNHSGDFLDRKLESLLRDWHRSQDLLFSVYPADGSFLVWLVDWLDEYNPGSFRQAQVSFASRIPNAIPLGDASTMSHYLYLYSPHAGLDLRMALSPSFVDINRESSLKPNTSDMDSIDSQSRKNTPLCTCAHSSSTPIICMLSKHNNGSLNLWHMTFGENSHYTQVLSIGHATRICGHRFRINDVSCHPVLPLLLTTSHHNLPGRSGSQSPSPSTPSSPCCPDPTQIGLQAGFCSELILWKVEPVGPLSKSGGITELARINSLETAAFANVAWIPTLLPSTTQGSISNSPSACFVASDGHQLRIYQSVIDARALLAEMLLSSRRKSMQDMSQSSSSSSGLGYRHGSLHETFKIVSEQSTSRPGCVIELDSISDATHDWQNTMLLHVFQEQLITSSPPVKKSDGENIGLVQPDLQAIVDLRHSSVFEEPFYLVVLEKQEERSVIHMWRIVIASQIATEEHDPNYTYVPDANIVQDSDHSNHSSRSQTPEPSQSHMNPLPQVSPLRVATTKVCTQVLVLPSDVEIVHATPAAGHLSSSNIYPACYAPYLICTACSDHTIRFWKCEFIAQPDKEETETEKSLYSWVEWEMMMNNKCSSIQVPGQPLYVSCAYSGRMACAYKYGRSFTKHAPEQHSGRFINVSVAIYECESTGGSEWVLEDTINLRNVSLPQVNLGSNLNLDSLYDASEKNRRTAEVLIKKISTEDPTSDHCPPLQRLLSVPSYTTLQTLRQAIIEQGNQCVLTQKSLVQLDWASAEDGSHILTVAISSKILLFTPVSNDIAQANVQAMKASKSASRPLLKQASSMVLPLSCNDEIRWMRIRTTYLKTADSLPPLPMHCSWVRHGILVVGMDNEMHIYSQWRVPASAKEEPKAESEKDDNIADGRKLTEEELLSKAQEISQLRLPTQSGTLSRSTSSTILNVAAETKRKKTDTHGNKSQPSRDSLSNLGPMPDFGLFEACRLACPVLPQYHPKQLMELLGFGKLRRVKAILSHLVRCLSGTENVKKTYLQVPEGSTGTDGEAEGGGRSWSRTRAMSLAASSSPLQPSPMDPQGSLSLFPEEVTLDYVEIQSIPPLPLFTLLSADTESTNQAPLTQNEEGVASDQDYSGLFDTAYETEENLDEILHDKLQLGGNKRDRPSISGGNEQKFALTHFSTKQATLLTRFLTHSHLPGLSSLDQMHLLALADTVASFNTALADRFGTEITVPKEPAKAQVDGLNVQITTESLDDCGLRFLLAMRHYTYLLRCLPLVQRAQLQNQGLGSHSLVWAFHSETQEELLQLVPCVQRGNPKWSELKELGIGWWVRSNTVLRKLMEKVAKAAFQAKNDPLDAALYYLAMKKKTLVWGLFRSVHDQKMTDFFKNNFNDDKWRKSALKNAFALMGKQRFNHAAAFFLLAGSLNDAVDVCLNKLDDLQLAMVIIRLYEGEIETVTPALRNLLFEEVLGCENDGSNYIPSKAHPNPFLRCMARWILQDYCGSLTTLLQTDVGYSHPKATEAEMSDSDRMSANPSVFNFYLFLRMHPLVVRRQKNKNRPNIITKQSSKDNEVPYEDAISPLERRLFFTTSHAHFRAGCPALALEVLSRLPCHVASDGPMSPDDAVFDFANVLNGEDKTIVTGIFNNTAETKVPQNDIFASNVGGSSMDFDWGAPVMKPTFDEPLELKLEISDSGSEDGLEMKMENPEIQNDTIVSDDKPETQLDIMAQQLKFIACLKIMMEELSTLATGFEADGGQLRYQLYVWLERSVSALKDLCNYGCANSSDSNTTTVTDDTGVGSSGQFSPHTGSQIEGSSDMQSESRPSLHEILLADKLDFETKLQRANRRKQWLKANEALLRTLLSYCSLHGALGGGLAAVRIELIFLLHELQQERSQQQLLSPLPFPTTLPLLTASVACQKTVVADPIRHLQSLTHDILLTLVDMTEPPIVTGSTFSCVVILRDLSTSLSACIYESLCDSDTFVVKQGGARGLSMEILISSGVVYQNSHLLAGHMRHRQFLNKEQNGKITTSPNKWPGVPSLRALLAQDKDEDSPKLHTLLCEAFVAVYLSQLIHAVSTCDCHVLYRLVGLNFTKDTWGALFGGGTKVLLHVSSGTVSSTPPVTPAPSLDKDNSTADSGTSLFDSFSRQRIKLHMKFLGQQGQLPTQPEIKEGRPTYREQFIPPQQSMLSLLMTKAQLPSEWTSLDYDSNESLPSDEDIEGDEHEIDDVFGESHESSAPSGSMRKKIVSDSGGLDQLDPSSYTWGILRYAVIKLAHEHLFHFLNVAGIEVNELPIVSPLLHATLKSLESWLKYLKAYMDSFEGPPPNYIPGCYMENTKSGPAILKYKALLELHNTPFRSNRRATLPVKRLWNYLVRQESVQDIFIRYIFKRKPSHLQVHEIDSIHDTSTPENVSTEPIRIIHKDQDTISTFCISHVSKGFIALATPKEIQELNIAVLLEPIPWLENEAEYDVINLLKSADTIPSSEYLVVQHPLDKVSTAHSAANSTLTSPTTSGPPPLSGQTGRGSTVLAKHKIDGVRKLASHPLMPVYLSGSQDGSVHLWEWSHNQRLSSPRPSGTFAKVTRILFNLQGNKFGVTDGDGNISLWQVGLSSVSNKPFFSAQCHNKNASDFAFVGSSSLIATSGYSSDNKNVCLWDTLLPQRKSLVASFTCHDHGSSAILYATQNQVLISAGKKGDICIFDVRQRQLRHKFTAHDSPIKCIALDPGEEFFASGSTDGDIKVWGLNVHVKLFSFSGEHTKSTLFRNVSNGVSQIEIDEEGRLYSCGADGSLKLRTLPDRDSIVNAVVQ